jgi:hypothetical protein
VLSTKRGKADNANNEQLVGTGGKPTIAKLNICSVEKVEVDAPATVECATGQ